MIDAALAPIYDLLNERPRYGDPISLRAWGTDGWDGLQLSADQGGPKKDNEMFNIVARSHVDIWETFTLGKGKPMWTKKSE